VVTTAGDRPQARRDFFVSHADVDQPWAEWIADQLVNAGYTVELGVWEWSPGTNFVGAAQEALERADHLVAVYTSAYFTRPFAQAEHGSAFTAAPGRIVPVRVEDCTVPDLYANLIRIELAGLDEAAARRRLLSGVTRALGGPARRAPFPGLHRGAAVHPPVGPPSSHIFPRARAPVWNIPPRNPFFIGRAVLLQDIDERLREARGGDNAVAIVPLRGIGGVGKTQLAIEYAHAHGSAYEIVWWVNAENPTLATAGLIELAERLGVPAATPETAVRLLWEELDGRDDWLLVYDNVDERESARLSSLRPPGGGRLLLTSRSPQVGRLADLVEVGEFHRTESVALLRRRCPTLTVDEAEIVAERLGDLPLAIEQAGCFLMDTGLQIADYLELLADEPVAAGLADPTFDRHPGLAAVLDPSRELLTQRDPHAAELLDQLAFLAPEPLPLLPRSSAPHIGAFAVAFADAATTARGVRALVELGLARRVGTSLQVHRLTQALLRARLSPTDAARTHRAARLLLATAIPGGRFRADDPTRWAGLALLTPHVQALLAGEPAAQDPDPPEFRDLVCVVASYLFFSGQYETACALATAAHTRWVHSLGENHPDTLTAANSLAIVLSEGLGQYGPARELGEATLAARRGVLGEDHPDTLESAWSNLSFLLGMADYAEAKNLAADTWRRRRRVLGDSHVDTVWSQYQLAVCLLCLRDARQARLLAQDTLTRREHALGSDHPDVLRSRWLIASCDRATGEYGAARARFDETLTICRRVLGVDHPFSLIVLRDLAGTLLDLGDRDTALPLAEESLTRMLRVHGAGHAESLESADLLVTLLLSENQGARALAIARAAIEAGRRSLGPDHPLLGPILEKAAAARTTLGER